jgi:hypothetical protein
MTIQLAPVLRALGTNSVREMMRRTGSNDPSLLKSAQIGTIEAFYRKNGGYRGALGFPLDDVRFTGQTALRSFAGGKVRLTADGPKGEQITVVQVRFVGFHCREESDHDQGSGQDEPYFIIGVAAANGSRTVRFGPYGDINSGSNRFEAAEIVRKADEITPPIVLGVVAMEHDHGSAEEAEGKVRKVIEALEKKFDQIVGGFTSANTDNHVLPEWSRDILIGWLPEGIAAVFGLADDNIGKTPVVLFDNKSDLEEWRAPAVKGKHGQNEYNVVVPIEGGDEGKYDLFFMVNLIDRTDTWRPLEG